MRLCCMINIIISDNRVFFKVVCFGLAMNLPGCIFFLDKYKIIC